MLSNEDIARVCHEVNRAYCAAIGDDPQPTWDLASSWQKESARKGVEFVRATPLAKPSDTHESWLADKRAAGWKYGPVRNGELGEHPCFVPYADLPLAQRVKDHLFIAVVRSLA